MIHAVIHLSTHANDSQRPSAVCPLRSRERPCERLTTTIVPRRFWRRGNQITTIYVVHLRAHLHLASAPRERFTMTIVPRRFWRRGKPNHDDLRHRSSPCPLTSRKRRGLYTPPHVLISADQNYAYVLLQPFWLEINSAMAHSASLSADQH
ncbi:hypothetical protein K443DRAFT_10632 [Laccaria amethystina LaAM-08-1]|uniref:Uncharacterized protein n=1 Tax=Laccaria amethystina LaAM-08-1 TaxID=1095629 RepID=A0A0C9WKK1_9AGAR|nr:hypothetical protein K443DRAFT_10632 [Laccaria amethystina LaAM-08-1]